MKVSIKEQLKLDLELYGIAYVYDINGVKYRLDPVCVLKIEAKESIWSSDPVLSKGAITPNELRDLSS